MHTSVLKLHVHNSGCKSHMLSVPGQLGTRVDTLQGRTAAQEC